MESLVRNQAQAQAQSGHRVDVVAINHITPAGKDVLSTNFGVTSTYREADGDVVVHRVGRIGNFAKCDVSPSLRRTLVAIATANPDIWHLHTPNPTMILALQPLLETCKPLVVTHHSDILNQRYLRPAYELAERRVYHRANIILSDSPDYVDGSSQLQAHLGRVHVLPLGVDTSEYKSPSNEVLEWEQRYRTQFNHPMWLAVGRLCPYKGLDIAIRALATTPGHLVLVGTGPCEASLRRLASQLHVADRVHWLGRCSEAQLKGAYRAATALWFPSIARNEGFGIVQVEAMASGCPVINTDIPHSGVSWVSQHEQTGLTTKAGCPESLSLAAKRLIQEPDLRDMLSTAAVERALSTFDQRTLNKQSLDVYSQAIGETRRLASPQNPVTR